MFNRSSANPNRMPANQPTIQGRGFVPGKTRNLAALITRTGVLAGLWCLLLANCAHAGTLQTLHGNFVREVAGIHPVDRLPASQSMDLAICLPLRNKTELTNLLKEICDPATPNYQQFLSSDQFTERFGPTESDYQAVMAFARANGFTITDTYSNRVVVDVRGSVADIERTFHVTMRVYPHPSEPRTFHAADAEPSLDLAVPVQEICGLDNFMPPRPMNLVRRKDDASGVKSFATGSGQGGDFLGFDFRAAYAPGVTLTGVGQTIGLFELGEYFTNDIILYKQTAGLPNITVTNVLLDGLTGTPAPGTDDGEETLDIDMAMCMAPGATIIVYEGTSMIDILDRMASDNKAKQMSCSFGVYPPPSTMDNVFMQFAAQGQNFFVAAGDGGAYNSSQTIFAPADDPNIVSVGGTSLTTSGPRGTWVSETTWIGSGGGITPHYSIPSYQVGMNTSTNHGSTSQRNFPDVSILADTVIFWYLKDGQSGTVGGTSAAAPLWAGFMALLNQQANANGRSTLGFLNPIIYGIGNTNSNYSTMFHDITTGNNTNSGSPANFFAIPGYDLATGWGSPNGSNLINFLAAPVDALNVTPGIGFTLTTPFGIPFNATTLNLSLTNAGTLPLVWGLNNTSVWLNASANSGTLLSGASTPVTVSLNVSATTNLGAGTYYSTIWITNVTSGVVQTRLFTLVVSPANFPIAVTGFNAGVIVPNNATTANKGATGFDIQNNIAFYQAGLNANPQVSGSGGAQGLPLSGNFASQLDGTTTFQFGPYGSTSNALMMGDTYASSGTLTFVNPQSYDTLAILASSANGGGTGTLVVHFTNGTSSQTLNVNAQDWFGTTANVALQGFGRLDLNSGLFTENNGGSNPNLYQTTINLGMLGLNQPVASISFTKPVASGSQDTGVFAVSGAIMPPQVVIAQQPLPTTNSTSGSTSTFAVDAMGTPPLAYQWYSPTGAIAGATSSTLLLSNVQSNQAGNYFVVVTNSINSVTSAVAALTVFRVPVVLQQPNPTSLVLFAGGTNTMSVQGAGALPLSYFWTQNGAPVPGATSSNLTLSNLQLSNSGSYAAIVSNSLGTATSSVVSLTVVALPVSPYVQRVVADHPISYYRLDETSGTIAHDFRSGINGVYNSTTLNQPGYNPVDSDPAAKFGPGTGSYVGSINIDFSSAGNSSFSVEAWAKGNAQSTDAGLITKGTGGGGEQFNLDCGSDGTPNHAFRFFVRDGGGGVHLANSAIAPNGNWHHLVGVCNESSGYVVLYIDGVSNSSSTITAGSGILASANAVSIGSRQSGTTAYDAQFVGSMDEVAIYNYALSPAQVQAHYTFRTNFPPTWPVNPFTKTSANSGVAYSGSLASNATDTNGNPITFSKITGPAWLGVAANGTLSGTPGNSDFGTNTFVVRATDPTGLSNSATMFIYVNIAPSFINNPFTETDVNAGQAYSGTIATNATDPNVGGTLSFSEVSGPAWLSVAANGTLSGTPANSDAGTNTFVVSATDSGGLSSNATMFIYVKGPINAAISLQGTNLVLTWAGGVGPYQVLMTTDLVNVSWQAIAGPINTNTFSIPMTNAAAFYKISGQ
jgi:hypothetical protein